MLVLACQGLREPQAARRRVALAVAAAGWVLFAAAPQWWLPHGGDRELRWAAWEQLTGSGYVLLAFTVLAVSAAGSRRAAGHVAVSPDSGHSSAPNRAAGARQPVAVSAARGWPAR